MDYCGGLEPLPGGNGLGVILVVVSVEGSSATGETVVVASVVYFVDYDVDLDLEHPATTSDIKATLPAKNRFVSFFIKDSSQLL